MKTQLSKNTQDFTSKDLIGFAIKTGYSQTHLKENRTGFYNPKTNHQIEFELRREDYTENEVKGIFNYKRKQLLTESELETFRVIASKNLTKRYKRMMW